MNYRNLIQFRGNVGWRVNDKFDAVIDYRYQITTLFYKLVEINLMLAKGIELSVQYRIGK